MRRVDGSHATVDARLARRHRFAAPHQVVGQRIDGGVVYRHETAGRETVLRVDVQRDLLQVPNEMRLKRGDGGRLRAQGLQQAALDDAGIPAGGDVAVEMVDQDRVERLLPLEYRGDQPPDEVREPRSNPARRRAATRQTEWPSAR